MRAHRLTPAAGASGAPSAAAASLVPAERIAARLPPLLIAAERVAATVWQGVHGRRRLGEGEAFWEFRRYQPGDPPQRIDWKRTARSDRAFVRQTEWEAVESVWLWRDASPSMAFRSKRSLPRKTDRATLLLLALAALLARAGEHFALLEAGDRPGTGRAALLRLAQALDGARVTTASLPGRLPLPRHGRVALMGDLLSPLEEIASTVAFFAGRAVQGALVQVLDPAEETLPYRGRVLFTGLEGEGEALFGRVESVRAEYVAALARHRDGLRALARRFGWPFIVHRTDEAPDPALLALHAALGDRRRR